MSDIDDQAIYVSPLENKIEKLSYESMEYTAKKYNTVSFKSPANDLVSVNIGGAVLYPGSYSLNSNSTLQDLYNLAGEFKSNAFFDGIIYIKENQKNSQKRAIQRAQETINESILVNSQKLDNENDLSFLISLIPEINEKFLGRITGSFVPNSQGSLSTILNDGDSIFVPVTPNSVSVFGEVLNPSAMIFNKNMKAQDAIDLAGGYKEFADKKNIYVIKADGSSSKVSRNIFVNNIPLEPGDTIIVPREILINSPLLEVITPVTQILSNLAFSASAIENLSNN
jgi:protein involved in polysaccharide export with SLBB domain